MDHETLGAALALAKKKLFNEEAFKDNIDDWLDDHPEATTTVQDGSITRAKLANDVGAVVDGAQQIVAVQPDQPTASMNKIWIDSDEFGETSIPTMEDLEEVADDVMQLSNALNAMNTATASDEGKALKAKTVVNGKVSEWEFGEAGGADPAVIEQAVEDWLDDHPEATTTVDFSIATKVFPTVADMVADLTLKNGDNVATRGYYASGDEGATNYVVSSASSGYFYITLENGLYANMLSEKGVLKAESIGIRAYTSAMQNPDQTVMDTNVLLFNRAIYYNRRLLFGKGFYYFSSAIQLARQNTYVIQGVARELTNFIFPDSDGLVFCDPIYYNYWVIKGLDIRSNGHCILVSESAYTVLDSHFEWLSLHSTTGDCFHGPDYNVYHTDQSSYLDTSVQNAVFDFCNLEANQGAGIANIMGMYSYYSHINFVSCKYAFRNCDGTINQANNLGTQQDYYIYYDKANDYGLRWRLINVNAEGLSKGFIYTEPRVTNSGNDPVTGKPNPNTNVAAISRFVAIASGWSLYGVSSGHDVYPWTVQAVDDIELIDSPNMIAPSNYPNVYDTSVVKGQMRVLLDTPPRIYKGGGTIHCIVFNNQYDNVLYGERDRVRIVVSEDYEHENNLRNVPYMSALATDRLYGGRNRQTLVITRTDSDSQMFATNNVTISYQYAFADEIQIKQTGRSSPTVVQNMMLYYAKEGHVLHIKNHKDSPVDLIIQNLLGSYNLLQNYVFNIPDGDIRLRPGESVHLIMSIYMQSGTSYKHWVPIADALQLKAITNKLKLLTEVVDSLMENFSIVEFTQNGYINTSGDTADINTIVDSQNFVYAVVPCTAGDEFMIIDGLGGNSPRLWAFIDDNGNILSKANQNAHKNSAITAPENATKLIINNNKVYAERGFVYKKG